MHECILKHKRILSKISHKAIGYITRPLRINDKNPRWFVFFITSERSRPDLQPREFVWSHQITRRHTRLFKKPVVSPAHNRDMRVMSVCHSSVCFYFSHFFLFFFCSRPLIHSKSQTRAREYAAENFSTMQKSLGRKVIYVRVFQTTQFPLTPQRDSFWLFSSGSASSPDIVGFH